MRLLHRSLIILLVLLPGFSASRFSSAVQAAPGDQPAVTQSAEGLVLEWHAPAPEVLQQPDGTSAVRIPGYGTLSQPGIPQVPFSAVLVALPPGAQPSLELRQVDETHLPLAAPVKLGEQPGGVQRAPDGQVIGGTFIPADQAVSLGGQPVVLELLGSLRGVQLARVVFYPARPEAAGLRLTTHVQVAVHFNQTTRRGVQRPVPGDPLLDALEQAVVNPQDIQPGLAARWAPLANQVVQASEGPQAVVEVEQAGLTAISYEALAGAGFPVQGLDPQLLRLSRAGKQIPLEWEIGQDGQFGLGDRLLFYAQPRFSRWTAVDAYFLSQASSPGQPMESRPASPAGLTAGIAWAEVTAEKNIHYTPDCYCAPIPTGRDGDRWVWDPLQAGDTSPDPYPIELSAVNAGQPASLNLWLIGYTDVPAAIDHYVQVALNGTALGQVEWNGKQAVNAQFSVPASVLKEGSNQLTLTLPGLEGVPVEGAWLDAFSIRYARSSSQSGEAAVFSGEDSPKAYTIGLANTSGLRAYDITDPDQPLRLADVTVSAENKVSLGDPAQAGTHRYWVTSESGILSPARLRLASALQTGALAGAEYLIITHPDFKPALASLVALHEAQGRLVAVEDVQAIYDAYGEGRSQPDAIRAYLAHAYAAWNPRPVYVLLVGDGTSDPKHYSKGSSLTFIPPYLADVDPWAGETAADNRYVTLEGDDNLPEMLIGRLPVNSLAEAQAVVDKIVHYASEHGAGSWNGQATFVADDPDGGGDFPVLSDLVVNQFFQPPWMARRLYLYPESQSGEPIEDQAMAVHQALMDDWNSGTALIMFTGHASIHQWAVPQIFHLSDIAGLHNGDRLPVLLEMTCFTASFQVPGLPTLDEALLRHPTGGVVAAWGPTGLGISTGHKDLADGFLQRVIQQNQAGLGEAILAGKLLVAANDPAFLDLVDTFTLLGDPAMRVMLSTRPQPLYLPIIQN